MQETDSYCCLAGYCLKHNRIRSLFLLLQICGHCSQLKRNPSKRTKLDLRLCNGRWMIEMVKSNHFGWIIISNLRLATINRTLNSLMSRYIKDIFYEILQHPRFNCH